MSELPSAAETAPFTTMASAMLFGTIIFATIALAITYYFKGDHKVFEAAKNPRSSALDLSSIYSVYSLFHHMSVFGVILMYAYICEYHPPFPHGDKTYDRDEFFFLTILMGVVALFTWRDHLAGKRPTENGKLVHKKTESTDILNRDQTEEWKGWMQFMFLLYHYYHAEEVYNSIRIMITCYVWMTGFGNFSFFYLKADYGSVRFMQMLWRLNFLVLFLCLTQGTTYILYYICLLHTYYFFMVYITMRIGSSVNYSKWGVRIKMSILALIIYVVWDLNNPIFYLFNKPFMGETPMLGAPAGAMWEWYFRSSLDHWSTFLGMIFALNYPITSLFFDKLEAMPFVTQWLAKLSVGAVLFSASVWWVLGPFSQDKFAYNQTNAYWGFIPLMTYIYFRNLTPWLRSHSLDLLHQIGKTTLETYLMQHHIWLTSNAKSLLILIPGWPKMNFLVVTIIYVIASRRLFKLTLYLRGMFLPDDKVACIKNLFIFFGTIGVFVGIAFAMSIMDCLNLQTAGIVSVVGGFFLFKFVMYLCHPPAKEGNGRNSTGAPAFSFGVSALAIVILGIVWNHMAITGAAKITPLPSSCAASIQDGGWVPVDTCNEEARGEGYRHFGMSALGTCPPQNLHYVWGWKATPASTHCRAVARDPKSLKKTLSFRTITYVGDSMVRNMYHAGCRQLGDSTAGAFNTTTTKHTDFSNKYGEATMDFRWASYAGNITDVLQDIQSDKVKPDVVVVGGGAWDRLHRYGDSKQQNDLKETVKEMANTMASMKDNGISVVWMVPTTINTWALPTDEKKKNMREDQMAELRELYKSLGVHESASFVLDGQSFTKERVADCYDGVHYPFDVYDGGAQIIANTFDWLLPEKEIPDTFKAPQPGAMAHPTLGLMMLCFAFMGIFFFDAFMGASYFAAIFNPNLAPARLFKEAFTALHTAKKLPPITNADSFPCGNAKDMSKDNNNTEAERFLEQEMPATRAV